MFLAILFVVLGLFLLLNTLGIIAGNFWGIFWAVVFLAIGFRLMMKRGRCPICGWYGFEGKMHDKIHAKMHGECCGGHNHNHEDHGAGESKHDEQI